MRLLTYNQSMPPMGADTHYSVFGTPPCYRFDAIQLDADDARKLAELPPEKLQAWLADWRCGFRP